MTPITVLPAEAPREGALAPTGNAVLMLTRQHQYPNTYDSVKDYAITNDPRKTAHTQILAFAISYSGVGVEGLETWFKTAEPELLMGFLKEILEADVARIWTGFRILGTATNIGPIWTLQLFSKDPESTTEVFDTVNQTHFRAAA